MKPMKPLEKIALLATLLASLTIHAEGTLPIPISKNELPLTLNGEAFINPSAARRDLMEISIDLAASSTSLQAYKARCRASENFYPAGGRIVLGTDSFNIKGMCSAGTAPAGQRQIIGANDAELVQIDGLLSGAPAVKFKGQVKRVNLVGPSPESGSGSQTLSFELSRSGF